jgi:hypothetical protein
VNPLDVTLEVVGVPENALIGVLELTAALVALVKVEAPAVAVTVNVYELEVLSLKVKVTEVLLAADVL